MKKIILLIVMSIATGSSGEEFAEEYPDYGSFEWEYGWASKKERAKAHHPNLVK